MQVDAIIPVFNGARYLRDAIESVLAQDYPSLELLVVDDGSTDGTAEIAADYGSCVRYHYQANAGLSAARNTGLRETSAELVAFLDADDLWNPDKTTVQVRHLVRHSEVDTVFAHMESFISPDLGTEEREQLAAPPPPQPAWSAGTMLARRKALVRVGGFSTGVRIGEFMEWLFRAREAQLAMVMLPDVVMRRRIHKTNMARGDQASRREYAHILKAALDRRRSTQE